MTIKIENIIAIASFVVISIPQTFLSLKELQIKF